VNKKRNSWGWWTAQGLVAALVFGVAALSYERHQAGGGTPSTATLPGRREPSLRAGTPLRPGSGVPVAPAAKPTLAKDPAMPPGEARGAASSLRGSPYSPERFGEARKTRSGDDLYEVWELGAGELAWLLANPGEVLTRELSTVPLPTGGLRVTGLRQGSFAVSRGIRQDDVILDINGQRLDGLSDIQTLIDDPAHSSPRGWRILLERDGQPFTLDYRAPSSHPITHRQH
jgi:hypothetical protein